MTSDHDDPRIAFVDPDGVPCYWADLLLVGFGIGLIPVFIAGYFVLTRLVA